LVKVTVFFTLEEAAEALTLQEMMEEMEEPEAAAKAETEFPVMDLVL
jgi:hypothetical protein